MVSSKAMILNNVFTSRFPIDKLETCFYISHKKWKECLTMCSLMVTELRIRTRTLASLHAAFLKQIENALYVAHNPLSFCEPYLSHAWSRIWFFLVLENDIWSLLNLIYLSGIFKKRSNYLSWLLENLRKLLSGTSTLRNLHWWRSINSIFL